MRSWFCTLMAASVAIAQTGNPQEGYTITCEKAQDQILP